MTTKKTVAQGPDVHADTGQKPKKKRRASRRVNLEWAKRLAEVGPVLNIPRMRQLRKAAGLTQEDVAVQLAVDPATISRIERGLVVDLSFERLHSLAVVYKTSIAEFLNPNVLGGGVHAAVAIPRLTAATLLSTKLDGLGSLLAHWRGRTEVVAKALGGLFCVELPNDGRAQAIPARALAVVDPLDVSPVDEGIYLLIHGGALLARRFQVTHRQGQFVTPSVGDEIPQPIFLADKPEIVGRIVSSIQSHKDA